MILKIVNGVIIAVVVIFSAFILSWQGITWGAIAVKPAPTVTVSGIAKTEITNQVAVFSAGINTVNDNKDVAVKETNEKIATIIKSVKDFGIEEKDIKTTSLNVYRQEESYYDNGIQKFRPGQWHVGNTIEIKIRDVTRATDLTTILTDSGATNIYGPNFSLDDTEQTETGLLSQAIDNARAKADIIARASNRKLGKIISVAEGGTSNALPYVMKAEGMGGGGGAPTEAGSGTVSKNVTVIFEIR